MPPGEKFRHIVIFKLKSEVNEKDKQNAIAILRELGEGNPNILEWKIEESLDQRKGVIIIENSLFKDRESFEEFRSSSQHAEVGKTMSKIADWLVADYIEE